MKMLMKIARKSLGLLLLLLALPDIALAFKPSSEEYGHTMITRTLLSADGYAFGENFKVPPYLVQPYVGGKIKFSDEAVKQVVLGAQARDWSVFGTMVCAPTHPLKGYALCYTNLGGQNILVTGDINDDYAHFDNDNFKGSSEAIHKLLRSGPDWENNLDYRGPVTKSGLSVVQLLLDYVAAVSPGATPRKEDRISLIVARVKLGKALHTLQDFYAHSTWADFYQPDEIFWPITHNIGNLKSNPDFSAYKDKMAATASAPADGWVGDVCAPRYSSWTGSQNWWDNDGNYALADLAKNEKVLSTSAWNNAVLAGWGAASDVQTKARCDHGIDTGNIANFLVSGIAKDAPYMPFAPSCAPNCDLNGKYYNMYSAARYSSPQHLRASYQAARHSQVLLDKLVEVIKSVAYDQTEADRMIAALLGVEEVPHRLALVVDTSASMSRISQGINTGLSLANSGIGLSLWTYDSNGRIASASDDIPKMQTLLNPGGFGGGDCPEPTFAALKQAIDGLPSYSSIYLFTDASASDAASLNEVVSAAASRKIKINPVVMGGCGQDSTASMQVYRSLASGTGGMVVTALPGYDQALAITKTAIARFIAAQAAQARAFAAMRATSADSTASELAVSTDVLLAESGTLPPTRTLSFPVDAGVVQMTVTASTEGDGAQVTLNNPAGQPVALANFGNGLVDTTVAAPAAGNWTLVLSAPTPSPYTVRVEVLGGVQLKDLQYESVLEIGARSGHEYRLPLGSTPDSGRSLAKAQLDGVSAASVTLSYLGAGGALIASFPLAAVSPGVFMGEVQVPSSVYWVRISGVDAQGANFSRMWRGEHPLPAPASGGRVVVQAIASAWMPGQKSGATLTLSNFGADETLTLSARSNFGTVQVSPSQVTLPAGSKAAAELSILLPVSAVVGSSAGLIVTVTGPTGIREIEVPVTVQAAPTPGSIMTLTVSRAGTGSGSVSSLPTGIDCGVDCGESYSTGSVVTLTATPANGSVFAGWSGACSGTSTACAVTMDAAKSVAASFNGGLASQSITFGVAPTLTVGGTGSVSARASSGLEVVLSSATPSICSVVKSGLSEVGVHGTVTGIAAGTCTIAATQAGNSRFNAAQATQNIGVSGVANLLQNSSFEGGASGWTQFSSAGSSLIFNHSLSHSGASMARLGLNSTTDFIEQSVTIPANANKATVEFWYAIGTDEASTSPAYDTLAVELYTGGGGLLPAKLATLTTFSNLDVSNEWIKKSVTFNVAAYRGQTLRLRFTAKNDSLTDNTLTLFFIDDISLTMKASSSLTPMMLLLLE